MNADTGKAIDELYQLLTKKDSKELLNQVILLSARFKIITQNETLGLSSHFEEKNKINLSLLKLLERIDEDEPTAEEENKEFSQQNLSSISNKIDFILENFEKYNDLVFYGFKNSPFWSALEDKSRDLINSAIIAEKEMNSLNFSEAIQYYFDASRIELESKIFSSFKKDTVEKYSIEELEKELEKSYFVGDNYRDLKKYIIENKRLRLYQMTEIIQTNVFEVKNSRAVSGLAREFYRNFYSTYIVRNTQSVSKYLDFVTQYKPSKKHKIFTYTLGELIKEKDRNLKFLSNLQFQKN